MLERIGAFDLLVEAWDILVLISTMANLTTRSIGEDVLFITHSLLRVPRPYGLAELREKLIFIPFRVSITPPLLYYNY